jgi:hypothetical protein
MDGRLRTYLAETFGTFVAVAVLDATVILPPERK